MDEFLLKYGIAIIGMAGRLPGANTIEEFWENLRQGKESISFFTDKELEAEGISEEIRRDTNYIPAKGILDNIDSFDASFFNISPHEAELIDPQQRLFLECAWETLERGGYDPKNYSGRIGVFASSSKNTYLMLNLLSHPEFREASAAVQALVANDKDYVSTRTSYKLNLRGPSVTIQTACSSSLVAAHFACQSLLSHECDMALVGGVSIDVPHKSGYMYLPEGIFSPDGHCRPFDNNAHGTVFGQGVGLVLLKPFARAIEDGDHIHAVIRGSAINNDGAAKVGFTAPSVEGQASVIADALAVAGVEASSITYVEAHGTGTSLGDPIEVEALNRVFRESTNQRNFCALGSVKSNIGHLNAASGVIGLIKTALSLEHEEIPPSLHFEQPNTHIDFELSPFYVSKGHKWNSDNNVLRAGVSSFGIGGTNAHFILEQTPAYKKHKDNKEWQLILLSAHSLNALNNLTNNLATFLPLKENLQLADIAYTLQVGRRSFPHRRIALCRDKEQAVEALTSNDKSLVQNAIVSKSSDSLVFMFSSQITHDFFKATWELYNSQQKYKEEFDACCHILLEKFDIDLKTFLLQTRKDLIDVITSHCFTFVSGYALARLFIFWGLKPTAFAEYDTGEYVAAMLSGVFSLEDAISIVYKRAHLSQSFIHGQEVFIEKKLDEFVNYISSIQKHPLQTPYISSYTGTLVTENELQDSEYWSKHLISTIKRTSVFENIFNGSDGLLLDIGISGELQYDESITKHNIIQLRPYEERLEPMRFSILRTLGQLWLAGFKPDWQSVTGSEDCQRVPLPTYAFEHKRYWISPRNERNLTPAQDSVKGVEEVKNPSQSFHKRPELGNDFIQPRNQMEHEFTEIFKQLLGIEDISIKDDFFELGGNSMLGTQFVTLVRKRLGKDIRLDALYDFSTVEAIAAFMEQTQKQTDKNQWCEQDLILEDSITPKTIYDHNLNSYDVFITGATGFLGTYLINEILNETQKQLYCLVRAESPEDGLNRIKKEFMKYGFNTNCLKERIRIVIGDLSKSGFGASDTDYNDLVNGVSLIYHCGARLSFVEPYQSLRNINVQGTRNVLKLASLGATKHIHYVSSIAAFDSYSFKGYDFVDEEQSLEHSHGFNSGYDETKWVSEMLIAEAKKRGFPVTVYRPGNITGDSKSGVFSSIDLIGRLIRGCLQLGYVPNNTEYVDLEPIDYVGKAIFHLSSLPEAIGKTYHITNPHFIRWCELIEMIQSLGISIKSVPFEKWRELLQQKAREGSDNPLIPLLPMFDQRPLFSGRRYNCCNTLEGLKGTEIRCPLITPELYKLYIQYLVKIGSLNENLITLNKILL